MQLTDQALKDILLSGGYATKEDIETAEKEAGKTDTSPIGRLIGQGLLSEDILGQAIAEHLGVPYFDLNSNPPSDDDLRKLPDELSHGRRALVVKDAEDEVTVASDDPARAGLSDELAGPFPGKKVVIAFSLPDDISETLLRLRKPLETRFSKILESGKRVAPDIIDEIVSDALSYHASDIHFEPRAEGVLVRFRVDGVLQQAGRIPREYYENILNRIKVQSRLRIDEHFAAQDGSLRFERDGRSVDLRTSVVPTVDGEKVVLRVLAAYVQGFSLSGLGLSEKDQKSVEESAGKPFGMLLAVGPTGSGKTTTLYALLKMLNTLDTNITTIEDPVEYRVQGVNQIQVNAQTNLTFAKGLRSIVRQDPDVILVGEIRDEETAEIAVNAALTGHLLLSTFHANDAATAIPRLLDMGIEPFLLSSTLDVVLAQRLVRKICEHCRHSVPFSPKTCSAPATAEKYLGKKERTLYEGKGCSACAGTGFFGRTAIFEVIRVTPALQDLILERPSTREIWKLARKEGSTTLFEDGIEKVAAGVTTFAELLRVAEPPAEDA